MASHLIAARYTDQVIIEIRDINSRRIHGHALRIVQLCRRAGPQNRPGKSRGSIAGITVNGYAHVLKCNTVVHAVADVQVIAPSGNVFHGHSAVIMVLRRRISPLSHCRNRLVMIPDVYPLGVPGCFPMSAINKLPSLSSAKPKGAFNFALSRGHYHLKILTRRQSCHRHDRSSCRPARMQYSQNRKNTIAIAIRSHSNREVDFGRGGRRSRRKNLRAVTDKEVEILSVIPFTFGYDGSPGRRCKDYRHCRPILQHRLVTTKQATALPPRLRKTVGPLPATVVMRWLESIFRTNMIVGDIEIPFRIDCYGKWERSMSSPERCSGLSA